METELKLEENELKELKAQKNVLMSAKGLFTLAQLGHNEYIKALLSSKGLNMLEHNYEIDNYGVVKEIKKESVKKENANTETT